jgi:signal transduction histidine kinase
MEARRGGRTRPALHDGLLDPLPLSELWPLLNRTHHVDGTAVRVACLLLLVTFLISSFVRHLPDPVMLVIRVAMLAYIAIGVVFGPRFLWSTLRAYTVGMALLLPGGTAALEVLRGNHPADLAITGLAIFAPLIFLQTGVDVVLVTTLLTGGVLAFVALLGTPGVPAEVAGIVLIGAAVAGATTALVLIAFRGRVSESTSWWQEACARERALREFVELAAPHLGDQILAREFAARFRTAYGAGHCAIVLRDPATGAPRIAATAGAWALDSAHPPSADALGAVLGSVANRQPLVCEQLSADDVQGRFAGMPWLSEGGALVLLPIAGDDAVAGAIMLSAGGPRPVEEEELLLWRAMANQVGVAVGSARLFMRLQDALRARSEFINTMSHELRAPLHVIIGYADMLDEGKEDHRFVAERVRASALELLQLVENTLAAAHLGSGKVRLQPSEFPLRELVAELRESVRALPEAANGVPVRWEVEDDLPVVRLDRLKAKEIVHNLVSNALKFTEQGAVTVRIGRDGRQVRVEVEDTGGGIPREAQARIFEMFERVETAQGPRLPGVGLGLYIVKSLVQMMGGSVILSSELGRGSRFTVWLPIGTERAADLA